MKKYLFAILGVALIVGAYGTYHYAKADIYGNGLIAWWSLDTNDISGTSITDLSGNGNTATMVNGPTQTPGPVGQGLNFVNASSQYATINKNLFNGFTTLTVSFWVNFASLPNTARLMTQCGEPGTNCGGSNLFSVDYTPSGAGGVFFVELSPAGSYTGCCATGIVPFGQWVNYTMTLSAGTLVEYLNGVATSTTSISASPVTSTLDFVFDDQEVNSAYLNGKLDDIRIYNRALNAGEAQELYLSGLPHHNTAY